MINFKDKAVLVLGGAGFIGSHFAKKALELGAKVTVIDNFSRGTKENLIEIKNKITVIQHDLTQDTAKVRCFFKDQQYIANFSALNTGIDFDKGRTQLMFEENMLLQMIPLRIAARTPGIEKFIQVSSASVYSREAMEQQVPTPEEADTSDPEPTKLGYALAKKMGENLAFWYSQNASFDVVSARFINVYGEKDHFDDLGHFIPVIIRKIITAKKEINVFGSGNQKRSFIYASDVVDALLILFEKGIRGEVYNIDSQHEKSVREVVDLVLKVLKKDLVVHYDTSKPEGSQRRMLDNTKLKRLGWKAKVDFEEGLVKTIKDIELRLQA